MRCRCRPGGFRATRSGQAYHRGMKKMQQDSVQQEAPVGLQPLLDSLNLLEGDAVGYCSNGVCQFPAPKSE